MTLRHPASGGGGGKNTYKERGTPSPPFPFNRWRGYIDTVVYIYIYIEVLLFLDPLPSYPSVLCSLVLQSTLYSDSDTYQIRPHLQSYFFLSAQFPGFGFVFFSLSLYNSLEKYTVSG